MDPSENNIDELSDLLSMDIDEGSSRIDNGQGNTFQNVYHF